MTGEAKEHDPLLPQVAMYSQLTICQVKVYIHIFDALFLCSCLHRKTNFCGIS